MVTTRSARPSRSTTVIGFSSSPSLALSDGSSSPIGLPRRYGSNGDGVVAASGSRYGRQPVGNDRSNTYASYTGSKLRTDRNARYRPSSVNAGEKSVNRSG